MLQQHLMNLCLFLHDQLAIVESGHVELECMVVWSEKTQVLLEEADSKLVAIAAECRQVQARGAGSHFGPESTRFGL